MGRAHNLMICIVRCLGYKLAFMTVGRNVKYLEQFVISLEQSFSFQQKAFSSGIHMLVPGPSSSLLFSPHTLRLAPSPALCYTCCHWALASPLRFP